jgi:hypothetical protein
MTDKTLHVDTGVSDPHYNLILVLQQALEDCHRYANFAQDARDHDDEELAQLFDDLTEQDRELADRLKGLLAARLA